MAISGITAISLSLPSTVHAHKRGSGLGAFFEGAPGSEGFSLAMAILISGMIIALLGVILYFRWRAANPLPEHVGTVVDGDDTPEVEESSRVEEPEEEWERPDDWWRSDESENGRERD